MNLTQTNPTSSGLGADGAVAIDIDEAGLLEMLGLPADASLLDVSLAHQRFLAGHDPRSEPDVAARQLKAQIRREANIAYASFRLVKGS